MAPKVTFTGALKATPKGLLDRSGSVVSVAKINVNAATESVTGVAAKTLPRNSKITDVLLAQTALATSTYLNIGTGSSYGTGALYDISYSGSANAELSRTPAFDAQCNTAIYKDTTSDGTPLYKGADVAGTGTGSFFILMQSGSIER